MYPTLFTLGRWPVPTYAILLELGLTLGLLLTYFEGKRILEKGETALDLGLWVVAGGLLGGRIGFVLANWAIFGEDWTRVLRIWEGGLSYHGAFLGGLLGMLLYAGAHRQAAAPLSFWKLGDVLTPGLAVGIMFGWAACLMGGCAYGAVSEGFGHMILPDLFGVEAPRFATQVAGLVYALLLFVSFWLLRRHWPYDGAAFLMYVLFYSAGMFLLASTRGDEAVYLGPWRVSQGIDLLLVSATAVGLLIFWRRAREEATGSDTDQGISDSAAGI